MTSRIPDALRLASKLDSEREHEFRTIKYSTAGQAAALLRTQHQQIEALRKALHDAATSLETISRLAGRSHYVGDDGERIPTYMGLHDEVRSYAAARAGVALSSTQPEDTQT